jgi:hypothetical protein
MGAVSSPLVIYYSFISRSVLYSLLSSTWKYSLKHRQFKNTSSLEDLESSCQFMLFLE